MNRHIVLLLYALTAVASISCGCSGNEPEFIREIYEDGTDSAFARLDRIPYDSLDTPRELSLYAVEHCRLRGMDFDVRRKPDKASALLELGRYKLSRKDVRSAAGFLSEAARIGRNLPSGLRKEISLAQAGLYHELVTYDLAERKYREAIELSLKEGDTATAVMCGTSIARMRLSVKDTATAGRILDSVAPHVSDVPLAIRSGYEFAEISRDIVSGDTASAGERLLRYLEVIPEDSVDWLGVCGAGISLGRYSLADTAISRFRLSEPEYETYPEYFLYLSRIYESKGQYKEAYDPFYTYLAKSDAVHFRSLWSDSKFIEEEYSGNLRIERGRTAVLMLALGTVLLSAAVLAAYRLLRKYLKENARLAEDSRSLKMKVADMKSELQALSSVPGDFSRRDKSVWNLVQERMKLLNKCISQSMTRSGDRERIASELSKAAASKEKFMSDLQKTFSLSRPDFIEMLRSRNLSDSQIQICCLYALGLRGKDIINYVSRGGHYNQASEIRSAFGLSSHDMNLSRYILSLLDSSDETGKED